MDVSNQYRGRCGGFLRTDVAADFCHTGRRYRNRCRLLYVCVCTKKHGHIVHISPIHAFNHKQVFYTHYTQTHPQMRLPTISSPIRHQTAVGGFPARAFDLVKWVSSGHTFLPSPSISEQPFVPIADYPSYLEAISLAD